MTLIIINILTIGCVVVSITLLRALPIFLQKLIVSSSIISFAFNFGCSTLLTMFIGAGMMAGAGNLLGSIVFAIYAMTYHKKIFIPKIIAAK